MYTLLEWTEDGGGWTVVELEGDGETVRLAGADEGDPPDGSQPAGYFGRNLTPSDSRELGTALIRAALRIEAS